MVAVLEHGHGHSHVLASTPVDATPPHRGRRLLGPLRGDRLPGRARRPSLGRSEAAFGAAAPPGDHRRDSAQPLCPVRDGARAAHPRPRRRAGPVLAQGGLRQPPARVRLAAWLGGRASARRRAGHQRGAHRARSLQLLRHHRRSCGAAGRAPAVHKTRRGARPLLREQHRARRWPRRARRPAGGEETRHHRPQHRRSLRLELPPLGPNLRAARFLGDHQRHPARNRRPLQALHRFPRVVARREPRQGRPALLPGLRPGEAPAGGAVRLPRHPAQGRLHPIPRPRPARGRVRHHRAVGPRRGGRARRAAGQATAAGDRHRLVGSPVKQAGHRPRPARWPRRARPAREERRHTARESGRPWPGAQGESQRGRCGKAGQGGARQAGPGPVAAVAGQGRQGRAGRCARGLRRRCQPAADPHHARSAERLTARPHDRQGRAG